MKYQKKTERQQGSRVSRRKFVGGAIAATAAFTIVPRYVLGGGGHTPPSEKVNLACIGVGDMGIQNMEKFLNMPDVQVVGVCDVNTEGKYYWGKMRGLKPAKRIVESYYSEQKPTGTYNGCTAYSDFRKMLEKEKSIDAVVVSTPDHTHAVVAMMAMKMGKHIYCEKPLAHSVYEVRMLTEASRKYKVATQMGNWGHAGEGIRLICEWLRDGAIGTVREVQIWTNRPMGWGGFPAGIDRPKDTPSVPSELDWDMWLGPAPYRPYHPLYAPWNWRGWWDFGGGALGDMGCHLIDPAFWALELGHPVSVEASSTEVNSETAPLASLVHYKFGARAALPAIKLNWYNGGLMPERSEELEPGRRMGGEDGGNLFIGDRGKLICDCYGNSPRLIPESKMKAYKRPIKIIPRSIGHREEWVKACKGGKPAMSNFDYAGPLTEVVLLGNIAIRTGKKLIWDGPNMKVTNVPEANEYIHTKYRQEWAL